MRASLLVCALQPILVAALPPIYVSSFASSVLAYPTASLPLDSISTSRPGSVQAVIGEEQQQYEDEEQSPATVLAVLPCQGCGIDGADEFFPINFTALPQVYNQCRHVPFAINGVSLELRNSRRPSAADSQVNVVVNGRELAFAAHLTCGLPSFPIKKSHWEPTVELKLETIDGRPIDARPLLQTSVEQFPSLRLSRANILYEVTQGPYRSWAKDHSRWGHEAQYGPSLNLDREDAVAVLDNVEDTRQELKYNIQLRELEAQLEAHLHPGPAPVEAEPELPLYTVQSANQAISSLGTRLNDGFDDRIADILDRMDDKYGDEITDKIVGERPLVRLLKVIAGAIGLTALIAIIRRRFSSLRRKVDRLTEREERQTARAFRRAARREQCRQQWQNVKNLFSAPRKTLECEEKRSLILAAEEECLLDEKRICEAEIELIREAHGIVCAMIQPEVRSMVLIDSDPRSRSNSLPSYHSEVLPGYSTSPSSDSGVVDGYRPPSVAYSRSSTGTPDSSIPDISSRCSDETSWSDVDRQ